MSPAFPLQKKKKKIAWLRHTSHTINVILFKCAYQWLLAYIVVQPSSQSNTRKFSSPSKKSWTISSHSHFLPLLHHTPSLWQPLICLYTVTYENIQCVLLWLIFSLSIIFQGSSILHHASVQLLFLVLFFCIFHDTANSQIIVLLSHCCWKGWKSEKNHHLSKYFCC